jgi:protein gp37
MTTVESQEHIWRIDEMRKVPAVVYGVSAEPLLGPITLPQKFLDLGETGWLITGGESGPKSRTKNDGAWHWDLMRQCDPAGVPFFFKQHGTYIGMERLTKVLAEVMKNKTFETKEEEKAAKKVEKARLEHMFFDGKVYQNFPVIRYR